MQGCRTRHNLTIALVCTWLLTGCGWGSATVASSSSGSSSSNARPVASALSVQRSATSPATIRFRLFDEEGQPANVELRYRTGDPGSSFAPITLDTASNPLATVPSDSDSDYEVLWDFAADLGDEAFHGGIEMELTIIGGVSPPILTDVELGNDAPMLISVDHLFPGLTEYERIIELVLVVSDSSSDPVDIRVGYRLQSEPDSAFRPARSTSTSEVLATQSLAFERVDSNPTAAEYRFRWESDFDANPAVLDPSESQLPGSDVDVVFRVTICDSFANPNCDPTFAEAALPTSTARTIVFHVDNNRPPLAILDEAGLILNPDERGAIPVPIRLFDDESDSLRVVMQWRLENQPFPQLESSPGTPLTPAELISLLDDPDFDSERRRLQIALEAPLEFTGTVGLLASRPLNADEIRLPELASTAAGLLALGIEGRTLEILRPLNVLEELVWSPNPLDGPVATLSGVDDRTALVLDRAPSGWRVRRLNLETGKVHPGSPSAGGPGAPRALAVDPRRTHLFVASDSGVFRFGFPSLDARGAALGNPFLDGPRALASTGSDVAIATGDDALFRVDFTDSVNPTSTMLLDELSDPWGIVVDPLRTNAVYVAESSFDPGSGLPPGRIVSIDLNELCACPVAAELEDPAGSLGPVPFPAPHALALERHGSHLLALCDRGLGRTSLRLLELRSPKDRSTPPNGLPDPFVIELTAEVGSTEANLDTNRSGLRILAPSGPGSNALALVGGVAQSRRVVFEPSLATGEPQPVDTKTQVVTIDRAFDPPLPSSAPWRMRLRGSALESSPTGVGQFFLWDSAEAQGFQAQLRVLPLDNDLGTEGAGAFFKTLSAGFNPTAPDLTLPTGSQPFSVVAADLNGDGAIDLVSADGGNNTLSIFFQTGTGALNMTAPDLTLPTGAGLSSVAAADLNGDGAIDLVSADGGNNTLSIFFQTGTGAFNTTAPDLTLPTGAGPSSVAAADLNGDGAIDLVSVNNGSDTLSVFFQTGAGSFNATAPDLTLNTGERPSLVTAADLNGDGAIDLVSSGAGSGAFSVFFQAGAGFFNATAPDLTLNTGGNPSSIAAADLNGDGAIDLVSADISRQTLKIFFQTSMGSFNAVAPDLTLNIGGRPISVATADLNGDGAIDLVSADVVSSTLSIFLQSGTGSFNATAPDLTLNTGANPGTVAAADMNGDGAIDLVSADLTSSTLSVFLQAGAGSFNATAPDLTLDIETLPTSLAAADLNGDGAIDLITAESSGDTLSVFFQTGAGSFNATAPDLTLNTGASPNSVAVADLNKDGALDLVSVNNSSDTLSVFFQTGTGSFNTTAPDLTLNTGTSPNSAAAADLNGDGAIDLVSADSRSQTLSIFFQTAAGVFSTAAPDLTLNTGVQPLSVATADLNGDGAIDLVFANGNGTLEVFFQTGTGTFNATAPDLTLNTGGLPLSFAAADLNGDGAIDLVSADSSGNTLSVFFQTGTGSFNATGPDLTLNTGARPFSIVAADFNADGAIDLVTADPGNDTLSVFFQTGAGSFNTKAPDLTLNPGARPFSVVAADLNADGAIDLVTGLISSPIGSLSIFFNLN